MKKFLATAFSAMLALSLVPFAAPQGEPAWADDASAPTVDGNLSEWSGIAKQASTDSDISYWQIAKDSEGNVYLAISGTASTQWVDWQWAKSIGSTIDGTQRNATALAQLGGSSPRQSWDPPLIGSYQADNEANGSTPGPYYIEVKIDASSFNGSSDYSIEFAGTTVAASDIPAFGSSSSSSGESGQSASASESSGSSSEEASSSASAASSGSTATYNGITIDGNFSDWDAVAKVETSDPNAQHTNNLSAEAMVFDGDYVYIYIQEGKGGDATNAGTHSNGQFAITTDLGNTLLVQLRSNEVTAGEQSVDFKHVGRQWEIAVPKSMLPAYQKTLNFGLYLSDPTVKDVANLDTSDSGNAGDFSGITYDGDYSDWTSYPHTTIEYATAGTQEHVEDAQGALYSSNGTLYTHVKTGMPAHLEEAGGEFLQSVTYDFGDGRLFYPNFATVDSDGTIHRYSAGTKLSAGTHELYIFDSQGWNNSTNINNLTAGDHVYGKVTVTVGEDGSIDEMESEIDLAALAQNKFNCSAEDFKEIKAQFGRLGQQWIETAGTSTNPLLGTGIAGGSVVAVVGGFALYRRRKQGALAADAAAAGSAQAR